MVLFPYKCAIFRQQEHSPLQVAFVASTAQIMRWAGVPRKSEELLSGYQRFRDDVRINSEITPFFQNPKNCSPTAVTIALRTAPLGKVRIDDVNVQPGVVAYSTLTIEWHEELVGTPQMFEGIMNMIEQRLRDESEGEDGEDGEDSDDDSGGDEGESGDEDEELPHLGNATLRDLKKMIDDKSNWENKSFISALTDFAKPGLIIDGQHRIAAGASFKDGIQFLVSGLLDASWEEQVFQFTVINLKPRKIPPALITSIAALSLSRHEQSVVEERLSASGVKMSEVEVMSLVAYDGESPFNGFIAMAVSEKGVERGQLLGYAGMKRLAMVWRRADHSSLTNIAMKLHAKGKGQAITLWRSEKSWFSFFCEFWKAVRFATEPLWIKSEGNKFFVASHLWALQEVILAAADGQMVSHWSIDINQEKDVREEQLMEKFLEVVRTILSYFPQGLWTQEWTMTGVDNSAGRKQLVSELQRFVEEGKKRGAVWKGWATKSRLVKSKPSEKKKSS